MAIVGYFIWNGVKNNNGTNAGNNGATPAPSAPAVRLVARTPPLAMRNSNAPDMNPSPAHAAAAKPIDQEHAKYQGEHLQERETQLGRARVQQIFDGLPDKSWGSFPEFLNRVESAARVLHQ